MGALLLAAALWSGFLNPPDAEKPWCYWWWINGHVDRETITADLESMKRLGFGGVLMFDSRGYWDDDDHVKNPPAEIDFMGREWFDLVEFSIRECKRLGLVFTMNASASGGSLTGFRDGKSYEVDITDREAVVRHLEAVIGPLCRRVPDVVGTTFTHIYSVSWEGTVPPGEDPKARDELIFRNFYCTMRDWAHEHGFLLYSESGGPWFRDPNHFIWSDQLKFLSVNDMPQGEIWVRSRLFPYEGLKDHNRAAAAAAHLYGKPIASAEAFTHMRPHWSVDPAWMKGVGDAAFADGINHFVWHTFTCSPKKFGVPGAEYFAGTHINRNVTWHHEAGPFVRYLARCQHMLRYGKPVVDFAVWGGSRPYQHTKQYIDRPYATARSRIPRGMSYDLAGDHALVMRFGAKDGRIVLPDGMEYSALILDPEFPEDPVAPEVAAKIAAIRAAGVPVFEARDAAGIAAHAKPDFEGPFRATHRRGGVVDVYFVIGQGVADGVFRVPCDGRNVEIWNAVDGTRQAAETEATADGRTRVKLDLPQSGSCFVVFGDAGDGRARRVAPDVSQHILITNAWHVSFAYHPGVSATPPPPMMMTKLDYLVGYDDFDVRHFAGTATYTTTFTLSEEEARSHRRLSLGDVPTGLAHVFVNGRDCGVAWCAPWEVDVSGAFVVGANSLEIRYVNNWQNRLIADCMLPPEKRVTKSTIHYWDKPRKGNLVWKYKPRLHSGYSVSDVLQLSGLGGPVELK